MNDLILRTRFNAMEKSLAQVDRITDSIGKGRAETANLRGLLMGGEESVASATDVISEQLQSIRAAARRLGSQEERQSIEEAVDEAKTALDRILSRTDDSKKILDSMQTRALPISKDLSRTLQLELMTKAQTWINKLEEIRTENVEKAEAAKQNNKPDVAVELMQQAWEKFITEVYKESQPVFAEYVDFLRGLALRDAGFDEGICQIADELISGFDMVSDVPRWDSLTIPAREETLSMTLARIIRLGFPEWTIWALPLAAHEFGHVVVGNNPTVKNFIEGKASDDADKYQLQEYLADAFATYAMGPAYVYAAILLRLDPLMAYEDAGGRPASAKRAHVMFAMLKRMDKKAPIDKPYDGVIETLENEWLATLHQVGQNGSLDDQDKKQLDKYVDYLGSYLDSASVVTYRHEAWIRSQEWAGQLRDGDAGTLEVQGDEELRDVLNAAWVSRVKDEAGLQVVDNIQIAARDLWEKIRNQRRAGGEGGAVGWNI